MTFKLSIKCDNAAFSDEAHADSDDKLSAPAQEVARILRETASRVENGRAEGRLLDVNGNAVGEYEFKGKQPRH